MSDYAFARPIRPMAGGQGETNRPPARLWKGRSLTQIGPQLAGFSKSDLEAGLPVE